MLMIERAVAVRYFVGAGEETPCLFPRSGGFFSPWNRFSRLNGGGPVSTSNWSSKNRLRASVGDSDLGSEPTGNISKPQYHPFEAIAESAQEGGEARLTPAETTRTVIEVNSNATVMFSSLINGEVPEDLFWTGLPYVTDEHGNIYFKVNNDEDIMQSLTSENNSVQVIIGLDTSEVLNEMGLSGQSEIDYGLEEISDDDSDEDDGDDEEDEDDEEDNEEDEDEDGISEKDWVSILEDEEDEDSDNNLGDWAKLETMRSSHPMYFANKMAEVATDDGTDWMNEPPAGLIIQGLLRPALIEEHAGIDKHIASKVSNADINQAGNNAIEDILVNNGHGHNSGLSKDNPTWVEDLKSDEDLKSRTLFYKLEMINIQLVYANGRQTAVKLEEFWKTRPDAIAHSAPNIIARLKAGGDKTLQALKSLCWRCKGIQVEEATVIGVDALGFDIRVCSGTQVQTLRFGFTIRATSEYSAERQLNDLLFPRIHHRAAKGDSNAPKGMLT